MKKIDLFSMSLRNLFRRKFRTILTVLGVVIGATSIILMLSLGLGMEANMEEQMAQMGDLTIIEVYNYGGSQSIDDKVIKEFGEIENVEHVVPLINDIQLYMSCGKYRTFSPYWNMYCMSWEDVEALGYEVEQGRNFEAGETTSILMGKQALMYFSKNGKQPKNWSDREAIEFDMETQTITLEIMDYDFETGKPLLESMEGKRLKKNKGIEVKVVGMFGEEDWNTAGLVVLPPSLYEQVKEERLKYLKALGRYTDEDKKKEKEKSYEEVRVKVNHRDNVIGALEAIKELGYEEAYSNMEWIQEMEEQSKARQVALGGIGIVSFVVAAIGIANTMMMSIYERTKEIGVMKVIGAKLVDIKNLFLMEALMIGLIGGTFGAVLSWVVSLLLNASGSKIAEMMGMYGATTVSIIPPWLFGAGIGFSVIVGLVSGFFPAKKAMKLSALSAIRTE